MLASIQKEYKGIDLQIVAINILAGSTLDSWKQYREGMGGGEAIIVEDTRKEAVIALKIFTSEATVVIEREGIIVHRDRGAISYEMLELAVERIFLSII